MVKVNSNDLSYCASWRVRCSQRPRRIPSPPASGRHEARPEPRFVRHDLGIVAVPLRRTNLRRPFDPRLGPQEANEQRHCIAVLDSVQRPSSVHPDRQETAPPGRTLLQTDDFQQAAPKDDTEGHCPRVAVQTLGALLSAVPVHVHRDATPSQPTPTEPRALNPNVDRSHFRRIPPVAPRSDSTHKPAQRHASKSPMHCAITSCSGRVLSTIAWAAIGNSSSMSASTT